VLDDDTRLQRFYVSTSRQLKRIVSVSRSPIYSHFQARRHRVPVHGHRARLQEAVQGAVSIRAYNVMAKFEVSVVVFVLSVSCS